MKFRCPTFVANAGGEGIMVNRNYLPSPASLARRTETGEKEEGERLQGKKKASTLYREHLGMTDRSPSGCDWGGWGSKDLDSKKTIGSKTKNAE